MKKLEGSGRSLGSRVCVEMVGWYEVEIEIKIEMKVTVQLKGQFNSCSGESGATVYS